MRTHEELHSDSIARGEIRLNDVRWHGRYCCLVPDADVTGRWITIASFRSLAQATAFCAGYVARRDAES